MKTFQDPGGHDDRVLRLRKIEGQVRGLQRMVASDEPCIDILTQIASARAALRAVALGLLDDEVRRAAASGGSHDDLARVHAAVALVAQH